MSEESREAKQTSHRIIRPIIVTVLPTYNPEISLFSKVIESVLKETPMVIVVDDGSKETEEIEKQSHGATFISLNINTGQAHALNVGVKEALKSNPEWILILDQDTVLEDGAISSLGDLRTKNPKIGIICMRKDVPHGVFIEQRTGILSGNLVRAGIFKSVTYREDFFIDQIGFDFWFRVRKAGYRVLGFGGGIGWHEVGRKIPIGNKVIFSEPHERFYYIVRNSTVLLREGGLPVSEWGLQILHWFTSLVMVEGIRAALGSLLRGLTDGLVGRLGKRF
jgi:rhamnosyltransferase